MTTQHLLAYCTTDKRDEQTSTLSAMCTCGTAFTTIVNTKRIARSSLKRREVARIIVADHRDRAGRYTGKVTVL
jgi:hypothetical protein